MWANRKEYLLSGAIRKIQRVWQILRALLSDSDELGYKNEDTPLDDADK